jgi:hypothetical protein
VRAGIWTAILVVMAVAIPTASEAQSCANGDLEFYDSICSCGGGSRLLALCADNPDSDAMCENGTYIVDCEYSLCDFHSAQNCSADVRRSARRTIELDSVIPARPARRSTPGLCAAGAFDRWFSEKLRSERIPKIGAGI